MISASILFVLFLIVEIRKRKAAVCVILILFLGSLLSSWIFTANQISNFSFCYDTTDDKERIFISENSELCLIDINEPKVYNSNKTVNYLKDKNILYLDNYFVTSYNDNSVDSLRCILSKIYIENLYLPLIKDDDRGEIFENILSLKNEYKTNFIFYEENEIISFESFSIVPVYYDTYGKCAITISYQDEFYTYVTADMLEKDTAPQALKVMNGVNTVIVGNIKKTSFKFIYKLTEETKLIYNKKTGLTDEILAYYENRILVDPNGAVELYVE